MQTISAASVKEARGTNADGAYYVYAHSNEAYGVFYVGKGCKERMHKTANRSAFWKNITNKHGFTAEVIEYASSEELAYQREIYWIANYKALGQCIANMTIGGDGVRVKERWWYDKVSAALTGIKRAKGPASASYKDVITKSDLDALYTEQGLPITEIAKRLGVSPTTVWERLRGFGIPVAKQGKSVVCANDGKVFASIAEAAGHYGLYRENLRKVLAGKYKTTGGLVFKYAEN